MNLLKIFNKNNNQSPDNDLYNNQQIVKKYVLDNENTILVMKNDKPKSVNEYYIFVHLRLINNTLKEINKWYTGIYYFDGIENKTIIKNLHLFKIQNNQGNFNALYDYINDIFVVPMNTYSELNFNYITEYNGILAKFIIKSDYEKEEDLISYINRVTKEKQFFTFDYQETYFAILNLDGSIRDNKVFRGSNFSKIDKIFDLGYNSLNDFKERRKEICNQAKLKQKEKYYQLIKSRNYSDLSPFLDSEVLQILTLKK